MRKCAIYIHGMGGNAGEAEFYRQVFENSEVFGIDYEMAPPWENREELREKVREISGKYDETILVANSIGAYYSMTAGLDSFVTKAYFISPVVDMEKLILDMMGQAGVTEEELREKGVVRTDFGVDLSWEYLTFARENPPSWNLPTKILRGSEDRLTSLETMEKFAEKANAALTVMEGGEHWFHTESQMEFLKNWLKTGEKRDG